VIDDTLLEAEDKMDKAIEVAKEDFAGIRTGRASAAMFAKISVDYYGAPTPLQQLASFNNPEARTILVSPFDKSATPAIEKAIRDSDLGVNPATSGDVIRIPMPPLTEERRRELTKIVKHEGENAKVAVRNIRRDAINHLKELLKKSEVSEDQEKRAADEVQKLTDKSIADIDKLVAEKEKELMAV
jgi:ribosome recycling factor